MNLEPLPTERPAPAELHGAHVAEMLRRAEAILETEPFDSILLHAGTPLRYFADDQEAPLRPNPPFAQWTPLEGPHHLLKVAPGRKPVLIRVSPEDYWSEPPSLGDPFWLGEFDLFEVPDDGQAWKRATPGRFTAYVGDAPERARDHGIPPDGLNPERLVRRLDWDRSFKTPYEVSCVEEACRLAAKAHGAARGAFEAGASELEIHRVYVASLGCTDKELPYESIVALDEKGATLHYTGKRSVRGGNVLLLDSGARHLGYASDITRTWSRESCDPVFRDLVAGLDALQQELCALVRPGLPFPDLHLAAHLRIGDLLHALGILRCGGEEALTTGLTAPFFPHGLGHFLGLQVHDVAGRQRAPDGGETPPPPGHPFLRTTRTIEANQVLTVEPGVYFIPMLLRPYRAGSTSSRFDWSLVDRLARFGGVRVEDDVLVTEDGHRNLTRPHVG
ncbi:MAG TPA: Xaa-Pro dipeptidase [Planctomycetota bacterium]|nr:Xaa-Pro dipeptidase [Planctomycetota bacterium]